MVKNSRQIVNRIPTILRLTLVMFALLSVPTVLAQSDVQSTVESFFTANTTTAIAFILSITAMKICAFVIGYLIVRLGHDTLIKGVSGDIDFGFSGGGVETKLKSASPGAFFVLAGAAIIMWALFVEKPITLTMGPNSTQQEQPATDTNSTREVTRQPIE
jgi:hypothetical protein